MAPAVSQQLQAQDPAPAPRCGIEGRTGHRGREGENGDGNRGGDGNEGEDGNEHEGREGGENGSGNGDGNRDEGGEEREPGNLRSGNRGGSEDGRGGATPTIVVTSNHSRKTRCPSKTVASCKEPEPRDGRRGTRSGKAKERRRSARNPRRVIDVMWKKGETWAEGGRNVDKKVLVE